MRTLGIIGGLGPLAGAHFYRRLVEMTPAQGDGDHLPVVLISDPDIPSRIEHLTGQGPSPVPRLVSVAERLIQAGAEVLAMPSTTTSYYHPQIQAAISVPLISLVDAVRDALKEAGINRVGILATTPTRDHAIYESAFHLAQMAFVYPDEGIQREVMTLIAAVKADGVRVAQAEHLIQYMRAPWAQSVDAILLGCTELPVVWDHGGNAMDIHVPVMSATEILARRVLSTLRTPAELSD